MGFWNSMFKNSSAANAGRKRSNYLSRYNSSWERMDPPDFNEEYASELYADAGTGIRADDSYSDSGLSLKESSNIFRLTYDGILAKDGARDLYAVVGFDDDGSWHNARYYPMNKASDKGYEVIFPVKDSGTVNIAFKDGADHWDDNSGRKYTYVNNQGGS